jgi:hypothetical protein
VAPVSRIADDSTVSQLLSRYAKLFKGEICVICTYNDTGVVGEEGVLIEHLEENLEDHDHLVAPLSGMREEVKRKTKEIARAASRSAKKTNKPNTRTLATQEASQVALADLEIQQCEMRSKLFAALVLARNTLVIQQLRENLESHMPEGQSLVVHCVSGFHYSALRGREIDGPRLSPEATGIPKLRAETLALAAPRLQTTLENYMNYTVSSNLKSFQAWLNGTTVDCGSDLLNLARQPLDELEFLVGRQFDDLAKKRDRMQETLKAAIPEAKAAASQHIDRKRGKQGATIMAFVRKNGRHKTKLCPRECWNEGFLRKFVDVVKQSQGLLNETREILNKKFRKAVLKSLEDLISSVESQWAWIRMKFM